jgi:hemerythrin superfamily protein
MARRGNGSSFAKWGIIGSAVAGGAALASLVPMMKNRAIRVTTLLKKDHRLVSGMIMTLQMAPKINGMMRKTVFDQLHNSIMIHAQAEEDILYPAMRNYMLRDGQSQVDESYREHQQIKDILSDMASMDPVSDSFDRKLADLKNRITHHVEGEEGEMFEILKQRMSIGQQQELGRRIHNRKMDLRARRAA